MAGSQMRTTGFRHLAAITSTPEPRISIYLRHPLPKRRPIMSALRDREIGDGTIGRAIREAQAKFWDPPQLERAKGTRLLCGYATLRNHYGTFQRIV
jgi:hypothetical protein